MAGLEPVRAPPAERSRRAPRPASVCGVNRRPLPQVVLGVFIVAVGVVALLSQLGVSDVSIGDLFSTWWPLIVIAAGVSALITVPRARIGPTLVIAVGVVLQLDSLDIVHVDVWSLAWPVAIILVGLSLLTRLGTHGADDQTVNSAVIWWGSERRSTSQDFTGGSLSAIMGGIEVDLREADIVKTAEISIFTLWGGVEVKVPPTWRVRISGLPLLGGWDDKTVRPTVDGAPELIVHVTSIMGGAEIKN